VTVEGEFMELDPQKVEECLRELERDAPEYTKKIPAPVLHALQRWAACGGATGHFVQAVVRNDLMEAVSRADGESLAAIREIMWYVYNQLPSDCWQRHPRASEAVDKWASEGGLVGRGYSLTVTSRASQKREREDRLLWRTTMNPAEIDAALKTLENLGYSWCGGKLWRGRPARGK